MLQQLNESRDASAAFPPRPMMTPEQQAVIRGWKEKHYRAWVDDALPALDGITPRAAMRTARGREKVAMLVREIERGEAMLPERKRYDVATLREELGLED